VTQRIGCADGQHREQAVATALAAVRRGDLVLIPTESSYALATDAFSARGSAAMRAAKGSDPSTPLPVLVGARATVAGIALRVPDAATALIDAFWPGPLTLLLHPAPTLAWDQPEGAPLAVRMPMHPVALALLARSGPLVAIAANAPGHDAPATVDDALEQLGEVAALAMDAGPLEPGPPSTIVDVREDARIVRRGELDAERIVRVWPSVIDGTTPLPA
jgi:tRNA threonylcarbamoyl adenosine modification protein (Sua5/YciO/YrdC/YwlC family)